MTDGGGVGPVVVAPLLYVPVAVILMVVSGFRPVRPIVTLLVVLPAMVTGVEVKVRLSLL